jgi:hypothetical protein
MSALRVSCDRLRHGEGLVFQLHREIEELRRLAVRPFIDDRRRQCAQSQQSIADLRRPSVIATPSTFGPQRFGSWTSRNRSSNGERCRHVPEPQ